VIDPALALYAWAIATAIFAASAIRHAFEAGPIAGVAVVAAVVVLAAKFLRALR
jgi:hypothetical protein